MTDLATFTTYILGVLQTFLSTVFTGFGWFGSALFGMIIVRRLIKIFKNTF